jgi:hypothetical protein
MAAAADAACPFCRGTRAAQGDELSLAGSRSRNSDRVRCTARLGIAVERPPEDGRANRAGGKEACKADCTEAPISRGLSWRALDGDAWARRLPRLERRLQKADTRSA